MTPEERAVKVTRERFELYEEDGWTDERVMELTSYHALLIREHAKDMFKGLWDDLKGWFKR